MGSELGQWLRGRRQGWLKVTERNICDLTLLEDRHAREGHRSARHVRDRPGFLFVQPGDDDLLSSVMRKNSSSFLKRFDFSFYFAD